MSERSGLSVSQIFAYRLRDARLSRKWNQQQLADAMSGIGHPINRVTITKIEAGARGVGGSHGSAPIKAGQTRPRPVSLDEAIAFAVALDVPPASLFLPLTSEDDVALAPGVVVDVDTAHRWASGEQALGSGEEARRFYRFHRFQTKARRPRSADELRAFLEASGIEMVDRDPREDR